MGGLAVSCSQNARARLSSLPGLSGFFGWFTGLANQIDQTNEMDQTDPPHECRPIET
jgi:hypothetical protein